MQAITVTMHLFRINIIDNGLLTAGNSTDLGNNTNITFGNPQEHFTDGNLVIGMMLHIGPLPVVVQEVSVFPLR
ncbi:MAG: hypothetical protein IPO94_18875 [Saprospiraceae bacterium]|nr:hypothetical protein [Saprospiraceae bacterium]